MSTQRIPAPLATALLAAEGGDFQSFRAVASKLPRADSSGDNGFAMARPRLVGELRSTRGGIWGGNDGKALFEQLKNKREAPSSQGSLENGEAAQDDLNGFEGRFRFSIPQPQPKTKLDI